MTAITRRGLIAAGSAGILARCQAATPRAAEFNYKLANDLPPTDPMNLRFAAAVKAIERDSGGRLAIRVFPAASSARSRRS